MFQLPLSIVSPSGARGRLSILIFHRVGEQADPLCPDVPSAEDFEERMRWIGSWFNVLPLAHAVESLYSGTLVSRALAITFDDGYADNEEIAAPILKRLGMTATFFIATGFLGDGCMFNDQVIEAIRCCRKKEIDLRPHGLDCYPLDSDLSRRRAISSVLTGIKHHDQSRRNAIATAVMRASGAEVRPRLMMNADQVRNLRTLGMDVGAHTVSHPILTRINARAAFEEIRHGKAEVEEIVGAPVELFAYPNGVPVQDYAREHSDMAQECGFRAAVSTAWGAATRHTNRYQLPRFTPWDNTRFRFGARMLANFCRAEVIAR